MYMYMYWNERAKDNTCSTFWRCEVQVQLPRHDAGSHAHHPYGTGTCTNTPRTQAADSADQRGSTGPQHPSRRSTVHWWPIKHHQAAAGDVIHAQKRRSRRHVRTFTQVAAETAAGRPHQHILRVHPLNQGSNPNATKCKVDFVRKRGGRVVSSKGTALRRK